MYILRRSLTHVPCRCLCGQLRDPAGGITEALTNIAKHAHASRVRIAVDSGTGLLDLPPSNIDHRRVLAVLRYLET